MTSPPCPDRPRAALDELRRGGLVVGARPAARLWRLVAAAELTSAATVNARPSTAAASRRRSERVGAGARARSGCPRANQRPRATPTGRCDGCDRARHGVSTGISAFRPGEDDQDVAAPASVPPTRQPGHVSHDELGGGLLERYSRVDAAVDAVRMAGLRPAATVWTRSTTTGTSLRRRPPRAGRPARRPVVTIAELVEARFDEQWGGWVRCSTI